MDEHKDESLNLNNQSLMYLALFLILLLSIITLISLYASRGVRIYKTTNVVLVNPFENITLQAKSAFVYDIEKKKVLFEKNADESLPLASVTKIMSAVTALELIPKGSVINIDKKFLAEEGDTGLRRDEKWKLQDIIRFSLVVSSNDGIAAVAAAAGGLESNNNFDLSKEEFIKKMNEKAKLIGMSHALFFNETGLDIDGVKNGGYSSARDLEILFEYTLKNYPEIFDATRFEKVKFVSDSNVVHNATNTNTSINNISGILGSKTGFTDLAQGNLGIIFDPEIGRPIFIAVLGSTYDGRFTDAEILARKALMVIQQTP